MGRFVIGFIVGAAVGATAVILLTPHAGNELVDVIKQKVTAAIDVGQKAAVVYEENMWKEFHTRLKDHTDAPVGA